jgi:NAD(P)-dependent dehydrogenase (short-subunit alcohol dehydrogenase family)
MRIDGSVILVTGAASGLGAAVADHLSGLGARLILADRDREGVVARADSLGSQARAVRVDVTSEAEGQAAVAAALDTFGRLSGLINCAGIAVSERVLGRSGPHALESFARTVQVNLVGTFNMIRLAAEAIGRNEPDAESERGVIVNTASIAAFDGQIGQAAYAAAKGGVASMTLPLARELARFGIRVVTIAPGVFETPMMAAMPEEVKASLGASVPFPPRLGRPAEYAALVQHALENPMLNGEVIRLDGALRMAPR